MPQIGSILLLLVVVGASVVGFFFIDLDQARENAIGDRGAPVEAVEDEDGAEADTEEEQG